MWNVLSGPPKPEPRFVVEPFEAAYRKLSAAQLRERAAAAAAALRACRLCPRNCGVDRSAKGSGFCRTAGQARVTSAFAHMGEEDVLRGWKGSGTIFFGSCNLGCVFCQNYEISQGPAGHALPAREVARLMFRLQEQGCHNVNLVTPSHVVPMFLEALVLAAEGGLNLPIVYNTGGYDALEALRLLDGIVDLYMPDFKFWEPATARRLTDAQDYPERAREAFREMHRQVGVLKLSPQGLARRGLLVRHLVMPGQARESAAILRWLAAELSPDTYVNIMAQYHPAHRVGGIGPKQEVLFEDLLRRPSRQELAEAVAAARAAGLWRLDKWPAVTC
jgi:putative pyruvate formate lyase activating enzyme